MARSNHALCSSLLRQAEERAKSEMPEWGLPALGEILKDVRCMTDFWLQFPKDPYYVHFRRRWEQRRQRADTGGG